LTKIIKEEVTIEGYGQWRVLQRIGHDVDDAKSPDPRDGIRLQEDIKPSLKAKDSSTLS
jgi:hypothetical protein